MEALLLIAVASSLLVASVWVLWSDREQIGHWWESRTARPNPREYPSRYAVNEWEQQDKLGQFGDAVMWFRGAGLFVMGLVLLLCGISLLL